MSELTRNLSQSESEIRRWNPNNRLARIKFHCTNGHYSRYSTSCGWLGYETELLRHKLRAFMQAGWTRFKVKVGRSLEDDIRRLTVVREEIGWERLLMVDANQTWDVQEAITWMKQLAHFKPLWIEEPTSPDDVFGHATIARALEPLGIAVATGEQCANRVIFKQVKLRFFLLSWNN